MARTRPRWPGPTGGRASASQRSGAWAVAGLGGELVVSVASGDLVKGGRSCEEEESSLQVLKGRLTSAGEGWAPVGNSQPVGLRHWLQLRPAS